MAILATMTSNIGKQLWVQELSLNFLVRERAWDSDVHSSRGNATVETARLGRTTEVSFKIGSFLLVSQVISRG